jgi:hypothetical protein
MPKQAFYWQLYIAVYTGLLGIPFILFPKAVIPLMGFDPAMADEGPFVHLTGMFLLCLTMITFRIWQKKIEEMVLGTVILRIFIIITLLVIGVTGDFQFLFIMIGVVGIGVVGTLWSLRNLDIKQYL